MRSPQLDTLRRVLEEARLAAEPVPGDSALLVRGASLTTVGDLAAEHAITLHELSSHQTSLEEAYMRSTDQAVEYRTARS